MKNNVHDILYCIIDNLCEQGFGNQVMKRDKMFAMRMPSGGKSGVKSGVRNAIKNGKR